MLSHSAQASDRQEFNMGVKVLEKDTGLIGPTGARHDTKVSNWAANQNSLRPEQMTRMQRAAQKMGTPCFIYNVSPIWKWERLVKGHGIFTILPRRKGEQVSVACPVPHSLTTTWDRGDRRAGSYVEDGIEIAESIVGCSKDFPTDIRHPWANLTNFGVFITYGEPLAEKDPVEQIDLISAAELKHSARVQEFVELGNQLYEDNAKRTWITDGHRNAAKFCIEVGLYLEKDIPWANRSLTTAADREAAKISQQECPVCGTEFKSKACQCPNCKFITNQEQYDALHVKKS